MNDQSNPMTDAERDTNREELRKRLAEAPDARTEQANAHCQAGEVATRMTGHTPTVESERYHSFLAGWDAAMNVSQKSLFEELQVVRSKHDDLVCDRFQAEKLLPKLVAALKSAVSIAAEAHGKWDADEDHRVGKMLMALAGWMKGYRADIDAIHATIAEAETAQSESGTEPAATDHGAFDDLLAACKLARVQLANFSWQHDLRPGTPCDVALKSMEAAIAKAERTIQ